MCNYCYIKNLKRTARVSDKKVVLSTKVSLLSGVGYEVAIVDRNYHGPKTYPPLAVHLKFIRLVAGEGCACSEDQRRELHV